LTLVNTNQLEPRTVIVQAGGYAEHQFIQVAFGKRKVPVGASRFRVRLAPGAGSRLVIEMKRFVKQPTLAFPWDL